MTPAPNGPLKVPILGQRPTQQQAMEHAIQQGLGELSRHFYASLAVDRIRGIYENQPLDVESLRELSKNCMVAARAYFEGIGIRFDP